MYLGSATGRAGNSDSNYQLSLSNDERKQGTYIIGTTGTGKTTFLRNLIVQDMWHNPDEGLCVLDPHGDLAQELLGWVPPERIEDVIYINPADAARPIGLNFLDCDRTSERERAWVVSAVVETLRRMFYYSWGPRLEDTLNHALHTALLIPDSSLVDVMLLLSNKSYRETVVGAGKRPDETTWQVFDKRRDALLVNFWFDRFFKFSPREQAEITSSVLNKLSPFLLDSLMRNIVGQKKNTVDFRQAMDAGKIIIVNLSKGAITETNSSLLGSIIVSMLLLAALRRADTQASERRPFHLYVDEFQNFATSAFAVLQSEARKYAIDVTVAHQYRDQLDREVAGSALNVGNMIAFRLIGKDGYELARQFNNTPPFEIKVNPLHRVSADGNIATRAESMVGEGSLSSIQAKPGRLYSDVEAETANVLSTLPNYTALCRLIRKRPGQQGLAEFVLSTPPTPTARQKQQQEPARSEETAENIHKHSARTYGRARERIEIEIYEQTHGLARPDTMPEESGFVEE